MAVYNYGTKQITVSDTEPVFITVEVNTDGVGGSTSVDRPTGPLLPPIPANSREKRLLGTGANLKTGLTYVSSNFYIAAHQANEMNVVYKINDQTIQVHTNPTADDDEPTIEFEIKFV